MTKVIVAGAGHGGLVAAQMLAKEGFDVTLYEKKKRDELGHDWEDRFTFDLLCRQVGIDKLPEDCWRFRGDCAFVSPSHRTSVIINYNDENRQKIMWRKTLIDMLVDEAEKSGVKLVFSATVNAPIEADGKVVGILCNGDEIFADIVIDSAGVFSPLRTKLSEKCGIDGEIKRGDVFYSYRAYFSKKDKSSPEVPFEVYLYHECEQGLSWCCTNGDSVDILIGRIDPLTEDKINEQMAIFRKNHPYIGEEILHGGACGVIPVRRALEVMVADGYAAVGDSAFMTTPMNGMGIDLSLQAGELLAKTIIDCKGDFSKEKLWNYNRDYHRLYGGETARNEGLKNSLLELPAEGVDFLFDNAVIQASDLAGAGRNTSLPSLLGKFVRGMKNPPYFFAILSGLIKGSKVSKTYKNVPETYDRQAIDKWVKAIDNSLVTVKRRV